MSPNGATVYVIDSGTYGGVGSPHNTPGSVVPITTATNAVGKPVRAGIAPEALVIVP